MTSSPSFIRTTILCCVYALFLSRIALAQPADAIGAWKLEELNTKDGKTYKGLVQDDREYDLDFAEIIQPQGKPMFAVLRWITKRDVIRLTKLPDEEHEQLRK